MIGFHKKLTGRMGNRLFQYHFLMQVSKKCDIDFFHSKIPDTKWFYDMNAQGSRWNIFKKKVKFTSKNILTLGKDTFLNEVKEVVTSGKIAVLQPPVLGELFFEYLFMNPNEIVKIKNEYKETNLISQPNIVNIAIHFRGTDFEQWNKKAILDLDYYINSISYCIDFFKEQQLNFYLFTDDLSMPTYKKTIEYLKDNKSTYHLGDTSREAIYDFYTMSLCDVIISSPSTFSIWAGVLGKNKKIIHSNNWLQNRIKENDKFWVDLDKSDNTIYKLWKRM